MKKVFTLLFSILLILSLIPSAIGSASASALEKEVNAMIDRGIMQGGENGLRLKENVTREEFAAFLFRALELPKAEGQVFSDVPNTLRLYEEINAAAKAGIILGHDGGERFAPKDKITREQMAVMVYRALKLKNVGDSSLSVNGRFKDTKDLRTESQGAVGNMVAYEITLGSLSNEFMPDKYAARDEAAAFISRMYTAIENYEKYTIATVNPEGKRKTEKAYQSFDEANAALDHVNEIIVHKGKVLKMADNQGIVVANHPDGSKNPPATNLYMENGTHNGGIAYGGEVSYVKSDKEKVYVTIAGETYYMMQGEVELIPEVVLDKKGRSYYKADSSGYLHHHIYNHITGQWASYLYGYASDKMEPNVNYYSNDGVNFHSKNGAKIDSFYQYFNMLPYRTKSNYTAEEIDAYINQELVNVEKRGEAFVDATEKSKLIGIGALLKEAEEKYELNALMLLAHAIHESEYGMSKKAQDNSNIFGLSAFDHEPDAAFSYENIKLNIDALANDFLNASYIPVGKGYNFGSHLGNKFRGINVFYSTDLDWGKKIAGHMLNLDVEMGGKDFVNNPNPYDLYEVVSEVGLNVRAEADVNAKRIYRFSAPRNLHYVVASISSEQKSDYVWHQIVSDDMNYDFGYVAQGDAKGDFIKKLNIAK